MQKKYIYASLTVLVVAFAILSSAPAVAATTFVYCSEGSPSTFNPQLATDGTTHNASGRTLYNRLVEFEHGGTKVQPSLAESWTVSPDGREYIFRLRKGVVFHSNETFKPSRPFNADDVLFSFYRMKDKSHPFHTINGANYEYFQAMELGPLVESLQKVDEQTVKFKLTRAEAPFLATLAMDFMSVLSAEYADHLLNKSKTPGKIDIEPIGTGPFKFKRYVKDTQIRYDANENYFAGAPQIKKLVFVITPDASVRFQKLKAGECHFIAEPAPQDLAQLRALSHVKVMSQAGVNVGYVAMNVEKPPLNRLEVRQAIAHALNRRLYIDAIYQGTAEVAKNPIPPTQWSYNKNTPPYDFNQAKAKELLKKAGLESGFDIELWTLPVARPYNPNGKKMGELIQADLSKIGIRVKLISYDWPTYLAKARKGEHAMIQMGWTGDNGDPDNFLDTLLSCPSVTSGSNLARWCDKEFNDLVMRARSLTDTGKRTELYEKSQLRFHTQAPWVPIAHAQVFRAMTKNVEGYKISPFGLENFAKVELKSE